MKKLIACLVLLLCMLQIASSVSETAFDYSGMTKVYVITRQLNGRMNPRKTGLIDARFDKKDALWATGEWSEDHHWIEVVGGEGGAVWVYADYVSETLKDFKATNERFEKVKIRSRPFDGKINGYLKKGKTVEITQVVLGWGRCKKGWIDMGYLEEVEEP